MAALYSFFMALGLSFTYDYFTNEQNNVYNVVPCFESEIYLNYGIFNSHNIARHKYMQNTRT